MRERPSVEKSDIIFSEPTGKLENANERRPASVRIEGAVKRKFTSASLSKLILRKAMQLIEDAQIPKELMNLDDDRPAQARNRKQTMPLGAYIPPVAETKKTKYVIISKRTGEMVDVKSSFTVGSGMEADYTVNENAFMSRMHAKLEIEGSALLLKDEASLNGTFLNGENINTFIVKVKDGDVIKFADEEFVIQEHK